MCLLGFCVCQSQTTLFHCQAPRDGPPCWGVLRTHRAPEAQHPVEWVWHVGICRASTKLNVKPYVFLVDEKWHHTAQSQSMCNFWSMVPKYNGRHPPGWYAQWWPGNSQDGSLDGRTPPPAQLWCGKSAMFGPLSAALVFLLLLTYLIYTYTYTYIISVYIYILYIYSSKKSTYMTSYYLSSWFGRALALLLGIGSRAAFEQIIYDPNRRFNPCVPSYTAVYLGHSLLKHFGLIACQCYIM